ncbi:TPA: hypothetical protein ACSP2D_001706 [Aeromonas veronii]
MPGLTPAGAEIHDDTVDRHDLLIQLVHEQDAGERLALEVEAQVVLQLGRGQWTGVQQLAEGLAT